MGNLESLIQGKIDADADFQSSLTDLSDDEKSVKISEKRNELLESEFDGVSKEKAKHEELAKNYKIRAEKAEQAAKKNKPADGGEPPKNNEDALTTKDNLAIMRSSVPVHDDDIDWLMKQAKVSEMTVANVLKDEEVQAVLKLRNEKRTTANATNTKPARPGVRKPDGSTLIKELKEGGKVPEQGSEEAEELFWARRGGKKRK